MNILGKYKNGNYDVLLYSDGTKIRLTKDNELLPVFAESIDCKITNYCDMECGMCHENSTKKGKHGDILNKNFLKTLHPYTEIAIGGGNALAHPDLIMFLYKLQRKKVIANITVNQIHFIKYIHLLKALYLKDLIHGVGISLQSIDDDFFEYVKLLPNVVVHVINGIVTPSMLEHMFNKNIKLLILGYKKIGRGIAWYNQNEIEIKKNQQWIKDNFDLLISKFSIISFDNLAIEQLNIKNNSALTDEQWDNIYMGDDGAFSFYIDMVDNKYAVSSTSKSSKCYDLLDDIDDMFNHVKNL